MNEIIGCRVCLATEDVKLYNLHSFNLKTAYEAITGTEVSSSDGLLQWVCTICSALLQKFLAFKERCCYSQDVFRYLLDNQKVIAKNDILIVQNQFVHLTQTHNLPVTTVEHVDAAVKVEFIENNIETEDEIVKSTKSLKKNTFKTETFEDYDIKYEEYDHVDNEVVIGSDVEPETNIDNVEVSIDLSEAEMVILDRQQQLEEMEARKVSTNYTQSMYKCDKCYRGFITEATYNNHMVRHDPRSGDYVCDICQFRWPEARALRNHVVTSHERKYICKLCDHVSRSSYRAKEHFKWHSGFKFECKICGATFVKSTSKLTHMRLHHPSKHSCELCGESFIGDYGLKMHKRRAHRDLMDENSVHHQCGQCESKFQSADALSKHLEESKDGICDPNLRPCVQCGEGHPSDDQLRDHLKDHQNSFTCDECQRSFSNERSYSIHYQRVHLGVKMKQYKPGSKRAYDNVVCEICGKKCITRATLRYHQRIHTGEKPYQCTDCPKKFSVFQRLQIHLRTHTGECPYKCKLCPKAFKHKAALNRHDRVHTGVKPYSCSHCGKAFSQSNSMKLHVNTVHLKMPAPYRNRKTT